MDDNDQFQLKLLRLQTDLHTRLSDLHDVNKVILYGLRTTREMFKTEEAAIAILKPGRSGADLIFTIPQKSEWDMNLLTRYIKRDRPSILDEVARYGQGRPADDDRTLLTARYV